MDKYMKKGDVIAYIRKEAKEAQSAFEELGGESGIIAEAFEDLANELGDFPTTDVAPVRYGMWISAKDRLPEIPDGYAENPEPVLYMMKNTKTIYAGYYGEGGVWRDKYFRQYADVSEGVDSYDVLCWMWQHDLPQPPKGENDG